MISKDAEEIIIDDANEMTIEPTVSRPSLASSAQQIMIDVATPTSIASGQDQEREPQRQRSQP